MKNYQIIGLTALASFMAFEPSNAVDLQAFDMQRCVNMGNSLDAPKNQSWGKPIDVAHFAMIRSKGFDTVRIPVRWSDYTGPAPEYKIEAEFMADVDRIVSSALSNDLNVILNVHHFEEIMVDPAGNLRKLVEIWRQVAPHFARHSDSLWFETLNEPNDKLNGELLKTAQTATVLAIRKSNPNRVIILGGENWSGINSLETNIAPLDDNIVYTYHYYDPFEFTHQKAPWLGKDMPRKKRGWGSKADQAELATSIEKATTFRNAINRPVFVGEFGAYEGVKNKDRIKYVSAVRKALDTAEIPWCLWSFSNTFSLYNSDAQKWDTGMLEALDTKTAPIGNDALKTQVVTEAKANTAHENWGKFQAYYEGETDFTQDTLSGVAVIKPGQEIHPPHKHLEEEFLMVLEGNGTWTIGNKDFPANTGDMLYAAPWDLHGIKNTGTKPLKFVVFKYNKK